MNLTTEKNYFEASARQRLAGIVDSGTFREFCPPTAKIISPHLQYFNLPPAFDDGVIVGEARINDIPVTIAAQEGRFMGGAIGEVHSAKIVGILRRCLKTKPRALVFLLDSGGVRLQEANAGEIGVAEIIRALLDVRAAGIPVLGLVGGSCGCYGGAGIIAGCCTALIVSEEGRIGVSGPEVIETNMGLEVFDSRDRALVWRTYGGKHRYLLGMAAEIVEGTIPAFRTALLPYLTRRDEYSLAQLEAEQRQLEFRATEFAAARDGIDVWRKLGFAAPEKIPAITVAELKAQQTQIRGVK